MIDGGDAVKGVQDQRVQAVRWLLEALRVKRLDKAWAHWGDARGRRWC